MKRPIFDHKSNVMAIGSRYDRLSEMLFGEIRREVARYLSERVIGERKEPLAIADLCGGTGVTIAALKELQRKDRRYVLVEPYTQLSDLAAKRAFPPDEILSVSAEEFINNPLQVDRYDVLICQEIIRQIKPLGYFFERCFQLLKPAGSIVVITRPPEVEFPFGRHARKQWKESYEASSEDIIRLIEQSGFHIEVEKKSFPVAIDKRSWLECVGPNPMFSTLSLLTSKEREEDLAELKTLPRHLHFNDHMIFILGKKM